MDEDKEVYKCVVCEKIVNNHGQCRSNIAKFTMGYGSNLDGDVYDITVCDECLNFKTKKGAVTVLSRYGED